jgi:hypothetical protein
VQIFGQNIVGHYKNIDHILGLGFVTILDLKSDSTFEYKYSGDIFGDKAIGTYAITKKVILLQYKTPDYDSAYIIEKQTINTTPPATTESKRPFRITNSVAYLRPIELKRRGNKLVVIKISDQSNTVNSKKMILKKYNQ